MKTLLTLLLFIYNITIIAQNRLSDDSIKSLYKTADIIFTAFVIHKNVIANTIGESVMIDFDITEIQKGKDFSRLMVYVTSDSMNFEKGKEYLVFASRSKEVNNHYVCLFAEMVCKSCTNYTIKKVYSIIDKRPFATIKKPRDKKALHERGCGCF